MTVRTPFAGWRLPCLGLLLGLTLAAGQVAAADRELDIHYGIRSVPATAFVGTTIGHGTSKDWFDPSLTLLGGGVDLVNYRIGASGRLSLANLSVFALGFSYEQLLRSTSGNLRMRYAMVRFGPHLLHRVAVGPASIHVGLQMGLALAVGAKPGTEWVASPAIAVGWEVLSMTLTWLQDEPKRVETFENFSELPGAERP